MHDNCTNDMVIAEHRMRTELAKMLSGPHRVSISSILVPTLCAVILMAVTAALTALTI